MNKEANVSPVTASLDLPVSGMNCAACSARIEKLLNALPGVKASVNLAAERARVDFTSRESSPRHIVEIIESRPLSKTKSWVVTRLVQKAAMV